MNKKLANLIAKKSANYSNVLIDILEKAGFVIVLEDDTLTDMRYIIAVPESEEEKK